MFELKTFFFSYAGMNRKRNFAPYVVKDLAWMSISTVLLVENGKVKQTSLKRVVMCLKTFYYVGNESENCCIYTTKNVSAEYYFFVIWEQILLEDLWCVWDGLNIIFIILELKNVPIVFLLWKKDLLLGKHQNRFACGVDSHEIVHWFNCERCTQNLFMIPGVA